MALEERKNDEPFRTSKRQATFTDTTSGQNMLAAAISNRYHPRMAIKPTRLTDQLRTAIEKSGLSRYAISKATGVTQPALSRFMGTGQGLSLQKAEILCDFLGLQLQPRPGHGRRKSNR